jgi:type I restriction enzyme S subunit
MKNLDFHHQHIGGAQPLMTQDIIGDFNICIPSLAEQKQIAKVLSSLDYKIEVNRRINDNLEQQAQALFKSWFVDFEPFKNGEFVDSELGRIPKGWKLTYISEIIHVLETGRRPKGGVGEIKGGIPSVGAEHIKGIGNYDYSKTKYINEEFASSLKTGKIKGYELLIYKDGGKPGYFIPNYSIFGEGYPFEECFLNEHVFKLDFGDKGYNAFCYFYFHTDYVMNYLNAQGGKAAIPGINKQDVENILVFAPENEVVMKFSKFVLPLIKQILMNCNESRRLAELRDTLLPKLMSGELKVSEINM